MSKLICQSEYLKPALIHRHVVNVIKGVRAIVAKNALEFDTIVFRGMSGTLIAPVVAFTLEKELLLVRKKKEDCHSWYSIEGNLAMQKYIVLDDCICSGDTLSAVFSAINEEGQRLRDNLRENCDIDKATCVGIVLYNYEGKSQYTTSKNKTIPVFSFVVPGRYDI